ncbi:MAG: N-acetyl-gamma-glutamyl-phosphate reductase [Proteobacteria bacterium]|nr:N-acetyl-gamma-glutamyl-phosphate reductase [Pseudomonadota bacterium]
MQNKIKATIIGASGYTGIELIRLLLNHPKVEIVSLIANSNAGQSISDIYSHLDNFALPKLTKLDETDFSKIDVAFCCLPHTTSQEVVKQLLGENKYPNLKIIDLSADFRLKDVAAYQEWYGKEHIAKEIQPIATYGLTEFNREAIKKSRLIACPGCYPTSALLPLIPLLQNALIKADDIIIDSKSGISGAGRSLKISNLHCEISNSVKAYSVCKHRHTSEIEQELAIAAKGEVTVNFTPHIVPMNRGIISTIYVTLKDGFDVSNIENCLETAYEDEYFVNLSKSDVSTADVYGTNFCKIAVHKARQANKAVIVSVIDNLTKGSSGQAVHNMNILYGFDEREGLEISPVFP